jgi:hypothetical protein
MSNILQIAMWFIGVLLIPLIAIAFRGAIKWTRVESKLDSLLNLHVQITDQMREDRKATNDRLTWLERNVWNGGKL